MDTKRLIGAIVTAFVILFAAGFMVHSVLLGPHIVKRATRGFRSGPRTRCATSCEVFG